MKILATTKLSIDDLKKDIEKAKKRLRGKSVLENFGEKEYRRLKDKYFELSLNENRSDYIYYLNEFADWCGEYGYGEV